MYDIVPISDAPSFHDAADTHAASGRIFTDAMAKLVAEHPAIINAVLQAWLEHACRGNYYYFRELMERIDGPNPTAIARASGGTRTRGRSDWDDDEDEDEGLARIVPASESGETLD